MSGPCRAWLAVALLLAAPAWSATPARARSGAAATPRQDAAPRPATPSPLERLRELVALGLAAEALEEYDARVGPEGDLASSGEAHALVARARFAVGREADAGALLSRAPGDLEPRERAHVERARAWLALQRDELERALALLTRVQGDRRVPRLAGDVEADLLLVRVHARRGAWFDAEAAAERVLTAAPLHAHAHTAWHARAQAAIERGDAVAARALVARRDEARTFAERVLARRLQVLRAPDDPRPRLDLAQALLEVAAWAEARSVLEPLVARWPDEAHAWFALGRCLRAEGDPGGALRALERGLRLVPDHVPARVERALAWATLGRAAEARDELEDALAGPAGDDPRLLGAHLALARLLATLEGEEAAAARYARYRRLGGTEPLDG